LGWQTTHLSILHLVFIGVKLSTELSNKMVIVPNILIDSRAVDPKFSHFGESIAFVYPD